MSKLVQNLAVNSILQRLIYYFVHGYSRTFRLTVENEAPWLRAVEQEKRSVILCCFHQQFFTAIHWVKRYEKFNPAIMISKSKDGDIVAGMAYLTGWYPVRGSSSRGGSEALRELIRHVNKNHLACHIVDGPRGPAGEIKAGAIRMAHATRGVIVPYYTAAKPAWYFSSWDRFLLPKPFSRVTLRFGDMIEVPRTKSKEEFERQRRMVENTMLDESKRLAREVNGEAFVRVAG